MHALGRHFTVVYFSQNFWKFFMLFMKYKSKYRSKATNYTRSKTVKTSIDKVREYDFS